MEFKVKRSAEGLEVLTFTPSNLFKEAGGCVIYGQEVKIIPGVEAAFPLSNFVRSDCFFVLGSVESSFYPISNGSKKTGFKAGQSTENFEIDDFLDVAKKRYGLNVSVSNYLKAFIKNCKDADGETGSTSEATTLAALKVLVDDIEMASKIPDMVPEQLEAYLELDNLEESEKLYMKQILEYMNGTDRSKKAFFIPQETIKKIALNGSAVCTGSGSVREKKNILFSKLLSAFSTTTCYNLMLSAPSVGFDTYINLKL